MCQESCIKRIATLLLSFFCIWFISRTAFSNPYYDNNLNIRQAHQELYALRLLSAEKLLKAEEFRNPDNGYITFYRLYGEIIHLTIANSPEEFEKGAPLVNKYIKMLRELPDNEPDYRLLLGEAYIISGLIYVKYDNKFSGIINCLKGYNLLEDNDRMYPLFVPDDKILGIVRIATAYMPKALQWGIKLFNINGNPEEGLKKLSDFSEFARGKPGYKEEALLLTMAAYRLMNNEKAALKLINDEMEGFRDIAVLNLFASTVCVQANDAETALILLSRIAPDKLEIVCPQLFYMTGKTKLLRLDPDSDIALLHYLKVASGADYIKSVLYDLACFNYIYGRITEYRAYIEMLKENGREFLTRDVEATFEAEKSDLPNIYLLRADYLVRGGYFNKAEDALSEIHNINTLRESDKVWYYYLKGECYRLRNLVRQAESEYLVAAQTGNSSGCYIAQNALVNSGLMMENNNLREEAEKYYNMCIQFKAVRNPYSDSFRNKARAGLRRLSFSQ